MKASRDSQPPISEETAVKGNTRGKSGGLHAVALAVGAGIVVLATACGGTAPSSSSSAARQPTFAQEVALAQCMRIHGAPTFPDPSASGGFSLNASTLDSTQVQAAYLDCRHLLPGAGPSMSELLQQMQQAQQEQQKLLPALVKFSQCMRSHGVPGYPDPALSGQGNPAAPGGGPINPNSPQFQSAARACQHELPAGSHLNVTRVS